MRKTALTALLASGLLAVAGVSFARKTEPPAEPVAIATSTTAATAPAETTPVAIASVGAADLSGHWTLNKDLSDNPRDKMREARANRGGEGRGMGGGGMRGGMGGDMRGGMGGGMGGEGMRGGMGRGMDGDGDEGMRGGGNWGGDRDSQQSSSMRPRRSDPLGMFVSDIRVSQNATSIDFRAGHNDRVLKPDGSVETFDTPRGGQMAMSSRWEDGKLVVTMKDEMRKTTEHWSIDPKTHRLIVTTDIDRGEGTPTVTIKRVWDKVND